MPKSFRVLALPGDGVGPELVRNALRVLDWFVTHRALDVIVREEPYGVAAYQAHGVMLRQEALAELREADVVLFGALGSVAEYTGVPPALRRQWGTLRLRQEMGAYANLRPVKAVPSLAELSPLRPEVTRGVDLLFVREVAGGLYISQPRGVERLADGRRRGVDTQAYSSDEIRRVARVAFEQARRRRGKLASVDKAGVMESGVLWREEVQSLGDSDYPDVSLTHIAVDTCAMELVRAPGQFDVLLADNAFGDILSDAAAMVSGAMGLLPTAALGDPLPDGRRRGFYEPMHGSAPKLVGTGKADPVGAILTLAMALDHSLGRPEDAALLEGAVMRVVESGCRTPDILRAGGIEVSTGQMTDAVLAALEASVN